MPTIIEINVETGDRTDREMTPKEISEIPVEEPIAPTVVTMRQARLAMLKIGMLTGVNSTVANMPGAQGDAARIEWEFSSTVERHGPLAQALCLTDAQLDDLFRIAVKL